MSFPSTFRFITISSFLLLFFHLCGYFGEDMLIHMITNRYFIRILQRAKDQKAIEDAKKKQAKLVNLCKALQV